MTLMRIPRVYTPQMLAPGALIELEADTAHHVATVLRMRVGDALCLFGDGFECEGRVAHVSKRGVGVALHGHAEISRESPLRITLAQGISRGERMDYTLQKAVELGVATIAPVITQRTTVKLDAARADKRIEHWRRIVIGACEQCGRNIIPEILPIVTLAAWLSGPRNGAKLLLRGDASASLDATARDSDVTLLIGPEGGMAEHEVTAATRAGYVPVRLGPRTLRTETAALAAIAALQTLYGDFRQPGRTGE